MDHIIDTLQSFGLNIDSPVIDGEIHRCHSNAKTKKNRDGWYGIRERDGHFFCNYGCWVRGEKGKVSTLNGSGEIAAPEVWKELEDQRKIAEAIKAKEAMARAEKLISKAHPADTHPYLISKQIDPHGVLRIGDSLIIPLYNDSGQVSSCQIISGSGDKKFLPGGIVGGCCYPIQGNDATVCICEGFATGASINQATGYKVLVAMNAGNLGKVAKAAIKKFPGSRIVICADNDFKKDKNVGLESGKKASEDLGIDCVWPTGIQGSDFNDMAEEQGLESVAQEIRQRETIECLTPDDCIGIDDSLQIPAGAVPAGLISQGVEALEGDILQYTLPMVLTVIARAIGGKISLNGVYPNVFNIKVGGTSTGKSATDKKFLRCLDIDGFISVNDIASGAGLWRAISDNPQGMGFFDEVTSLFQRNNSKGGVDMVAEGKSHALLDVFSRSGETFRKAFGDSKNSLEIQNPCFSLIGNATPTIFEAIQLKDFETGLMQRFDFWVYDGEIKKKPLLINSTYFQKTKDFVKELRDIVMAQLPDQGLAALINGCIDLEANQSAVVCLEEYSEYITAEANKTDSDGMTGFISRRFDLCLKYALIHHAARAGAKGLFLPVDREDIDYGILMAEMLGGWKSHVLCNKVVSGDFHRDCEIFKEAIRSAVKAGFPKPTFARMAKRRAQLKNWTPKYSENIIGVLKKRGEIITKEGRRSTQYFLPRVENHV